MTIFLPQYFEILKAAVLNKSSLTSITPSDCKAVSHNIFEATKFSLSETTLKRVYGFAFSKFNPSVFTIDVMAKYCGYKGWDDFCEKQTPTQKPNKATASNEWETLKQNANKITTFTLQALKNKSGIPYNQTIKRGFVDDHLAAFLRDDYAATVFCAPSGYGKTIGLCHWIEERLSPSADTADDVILFFSSSALMNVFLSGRNLNDWVLGLLGYSMDADIRSLVDLSQKKNGDFFLIIDGLDEHAYKPDQFQLLISQLMDVLSLYKNEPWFKLVLTMRTASWINNLHQLEVDTGKWYKGFITDQDNLTINVPLFNVAEIKELCLKINPAVQSFMAIDLAGSFNHPLYFQFYYKEHKEDFTLNNIDHVCIYELISTFILNKVYLGHYSADKLAFLKLMIDNMDLLNQVYQVPKLKINTAVKQYHQAYNELIAIGFIKEVNTSTGLNYQTVIEFSSNNFLQYTLAKTLLQDNNLLFDRKLINQINTQFDARHKLYILKWCIIYAAKTGQENSLDVLPYSDLKANEKADLVLFLGDLLDKACSPASNTGTIARYFNRDCSDEFFDYFFGLEFICSDYKKALQTLLKFELSSRKKIITYTGLATIAILEADLPKINWYLTKLREFPVHGFQRFAINPLKCIEAIYNYLKDAVINRDFLAEITRFYFNPHLHKGKYYGEKPNELIYSLSAYILMICAKPKKVLRFVNAVNAVYPVNLSVSTPYSFFVNIAISNSYYQLKKNNEMAAIYRLITTAYKADEDLFTPFMKSTFYALKIKYALLQKNFDSVPAYMKSLTEICNASGNKMSRMFISFVILNNTEIADADPAFCKQVQYENTKMLRECGVTPDLFVSQVPIAKK